MLLEMLLNILVNHHIGGSLLTNRAESSLLSSVSQQRGRRTATYIEALEVMLTGGLSSLEVLQLRQAGTLDLALQDSIVIDKGQATTLSVVKGRLPVCLSGRDHLFVSSVIATLSGLFVGLAEGAIDEKVEHVGGTSKARLELPWVSTGTTPDRQRNHLVTPTLFRVGAAATDAKVVLTGRVTLGAAEDVNERLGGTVGVLRGLGGQTLDTAATEVPSERRLRSHVVGQRVHEVRQRPVADVRRWWSHDDEVEQEERSV